MRGEELRRPWSRFSVETAPRSLPRVGVQAVNETIEARMFLVETGSETDQVTCPKPPRGPIL